MEVDLQNLAGGLALKTVAWDAARFDHVTETERLASCMDASILWIREMLPRVAQDCGKTEVSIKGYDLPGADHNEGTVLWWLRRAANNLEHIQNFMKNRQKWLWLKENGLTLANVDTDGMGDESYTEAA